MIKSKQILLKLEVRPSFFIKTQERILRNNTNKMLCFSFVNSSDGEVSERRLFQKLIWNAVSQAEIENSTVYLS